MTRAINGSYPAFTAFSVKEKMNHTKSMPKREKAPLIKDPEDMPAAETSMTAKRTPYDMSNLVLTGFFSHSFIQGLRDDRSLSFSSSGSPVHQSMYSTFFSFFFTVSPSITTDIFDKYNK